MHRKMVLHTLTEKLQKKVQQIFLSFTGVLETKPSCWSKHKDNNRGCSY